MSPFGGGMGSSGQVCGTLAGALAVIGFTWGKSEPKGRDHKLMWKLSHAMVDRFAEICRPYGGTDCSDIARVDWRDKESVREFYRNPDSCRKNCIRVVRETAASLHDLVSEYWPDRQ